MKRIEILDALKATNEEDILSHFPRRYVGLLSCDLGLPPSDGKRMTVQGRPSSLVSLRYGQLIRFRITDRKGESIAAMIFSQPFYRNILKQSEEYFFFGTYRAKQKCFMVSSAVKTSNPLVANPYMPYYSLPAKVSQSAFYAYVLEILQNRGEYILEVVPKAYREKYRLEPRLEAYRDVHVPRSEETVKRGLRVFKYEEALSYCLYSLEQKKKASLLKKRKMNPIDREKINAFVKNLPYRLTQDQLEAVREIVTDMDSPKVMNRLLEGDVGTGKTVVAFIAMYGNYLRGGQSVLLAPTLTLAEQHYRKALSAFKDYPVKIVLLDNSLKPSEQKKVLSQIESGEADMVVGTHSLFSDSVVYKNLTFAVEDEQHKFGVAQRGKLAEKGEGVDVLSMSATPIPRTMALMIHSEMEVSVLKQFPSEERRVETRVVQQDDPLIDKAVKRALEVKRQVFVVAPKIDDQEGKSSRLSSKAVYDEFKGKYGEENVAFLNGRMKKESQKQVIEDFRTGKKLILVSTSVIEVGVDVSSASLMIVMEANYFGLASLHQLRGRIGRNGEGALAIFVYSGDDPEAKEKLDYLASHSSGEDVALYDLRHRGGGDFASDRQSGESILRVANFVDDSNVFFYAKKDAEEILNNPQDPENASFITYVSHLIGEKV
jgi:ATP-dependent DNA helicase RecG